MSRQPPKEKAYVHAELRPVLEALRVSNELRNDFLRFGDKQGADIFSLSDRLRKILHLGPRAPLSPYVVLLLTRFAVAKGYFETAPEKP